MNARELLQSRNTVRMVGAAAALSASLGMLACGGGGFQQRNVNSPSNTVSLPASAPTIKVTAPINNSNVDPTVQFVATSSSPNGISKMTISVDNQSVFTSSSNAVNTLLNLSSGAHSVVVSAVDTKGNSAANPLHVNVWGGAAPPQPPAPPAPPPDGHPVFSDLQNAKWTQYSLLPPTYEICKSCSPNGPQLVLSYKQGVASPSLSGGSMQTYIAGDEPYSDGFWNTRVVGDFSPNPDSDHTLTPSIHHFIYDLYFYIQDPSVSQAVEFDINQFVNGKSHIWGHECRLGGGGYEWDIWNNPAQKWSPTGIPCRPQANAWNHVIIEVERTSDDNLHFVSITLNGTKTMVDRYDTSTPTNWYGITLNYQQDGDYAQHGYSVWLDKMNLEYW